MVAIKDMPVQYLDELSTKYCNAITAAGTLPALKAVVGRWEPLVGDAYDLVQAMSEVDFRKWRRGLAKERKRQFAGQAWAERFGAILIPEMLLRTSVTAEEFKVPEGMAFIRAVEVGRFKKRDGRYYDVLAVEHGNDEAGEPS